MLTNHDNGFSMIFGNGITVSVVFQSGPLTTACNDAEIVVYNEDGDYIYEIVKWENSEQFAEILTKVAAMPIKN